MHEGFQQDPVDRPAPARWTPGSRPHQCGSPTNRCRGGGNPPCSTHAAAARRGGAPPRARLGWLCCSCALRTTSNPPLLPLSSLQSRASDRHYSTLWPTDDGHRAEALPPVAGAQLPMRHGRKRGLPTREEGTRGAGILLSVALRGIAALCREHRPSGLTHTHATLSGRSAAHTLPAICHFIIGRNMAGCKFSCTGTTPGGTSGRQGRRIAGPPCANCRLPAPAPAAARRACTPAGLPRRV